MECTAVQAGQTPCQRGRQAKAKEEVSIRRTNTKARSPSRSHPRRRNTQLDELILTRLCRGLRPAILRTKRSSWSQTSLLGHAAARTDWHRHTLRYNQASSPGRKPSPQVIPRYQAWMAETRWQTACWTHMGTIRRQHSRRECAGHLMGGWKGLWEVPSAALPSLLPLPHVDRMLPV